MEALYFFEKLRTPFLDKLFYCITALGAEIFFIVVAITVYWCFSKKMGYYLMTVCFFGVAVNQIIKLLARVPRPWVLDPSFSIVEAARSDASGYSFPSGHTQNAVSIAGCIALSAKDFARSKKTRCAIWSGCVLLALLVAVSRMYLGVHTLWDVAVSAILAAVFVVVFKYVFGLAEKKHFIMYLIISAMIAASAAFIAVSYSSSATTPHEIENLVSARRHAWYMLGGVLGIAAAYPIEHKYIKFETKATFLGQLIKIVPGAAAVFGIKMLEEPLLFVFGGHSVAHAVRYFLMVVFAVAVWPACFRYLPGACGRKEIAE